MRNAFLFLALAVLLFSGHPADANTSKPAEPTPAKEIYVQQLGPAPEDEKLDSMHVYSSVPPSKPLMNSTRFKVVDDFASGDLKNRLGGTWTVGDLKGKKVRIERSKQDARDVYPGGSLDIKMDLSRGERLAVSSSLERLDMSQAYFLALKCKVEASPENPFEGRISVSLTDWAGKTVIRDITDACMETKQWNEAVLPLTVFSGIDLNQLGRITVGVAAQKSRTRGKVSIDEIAFFGNSEVGFESTIDNLKGFPKSVFDEARRQELLKLKDDKKLLLEIAKDTFRYFENGASRENHLVSDHLKTGDFPMAAMYTSPTNIAMDLLVIVGATELEIITKKEGAERVQAILRTVQGLKKWKGFFYNFYETVRLNVSREFVSSIDNAWLAISLVVVRQAFPGEIAQAATAIIDEMHFQEFLDPENNHLVIGYDVARQAATPYHYGMLATEARAMSFFAIGKGDLPREHWWYLYRTAPEAWEWQSQKPQGKWVDRDRVNYFQGYYQGGGKKFVPSWGGSLFEFLMPTLVIDEKNYSKKALGPNDKIATELHRDYALKEKKYPLWGISPAAVASGRQWAYGEYGCKKLGVKGYADKGVITPYPGFLALETLPKDAVENIRKWLTFKTYGEYGFYDTITFPGNKVNSQYLALDQGMIFVAITNYLKKGIIQDLFHRDPIAKKAVDLLREEDFFKE